MTARETLTEYVMALAPRVRVWRVGRLSVMEYVDAVGECVTVAMDQINTA